MFVTKGYFDREVTFWRERSLDLEKRLEGESRRNRKREDALLNRVLIRNGTFAIAEDEIEPPVPHDTPIEEIPGLIEVEEEFNKWADDAGASPYERKRKWLEYKQTYAADLG